jgi:lipopolysaccharide/colanic/teichoic acid biosynthesis glycosyltransferase
MKATERSHSINLPVPHRYLMVKRVFDLVVCVLALPIVLVVGALSAIAIAIDSRGPVLYTQERTGHHGRRFRMYKFRTMIPNADELKASLADRSVVPPPDFKVIDDPRITRVGGFLRRTGLDELPQVINVLGGTMSLVGPRPTSFRAHEYEPWHLGRLVVRPGVTGLWQVEDRNSATFDERVRYDLAYIQTMSLAADLKLLVRTLSSVWRREGA